MDLGTGILKIRKALGITQKELAKSCNLSHATLSKIEIGLVEAQEDTIDAICKALDIPLSVIYIIGFEESDFSNHPRFPACYQAMAQIALRIATYK